jgi:ligand-binding sensor domain-containing protein/signal transduction histidine kinase
MQFQHTAWTVQNGAPTQTLVMAQTKDGYLWLATENGLFRFDGVTFDAYQPPHGQKLLHTAVRTLTATDDGGLWVGYTLGDTSFIKDGIIQHQYFKDHLKHAGGTVYSIVHRKDGSTWAATDGGPIKLVSGAWHEANEYTGLNGKASTLFFEDSRQTLWMSTSDWVYCLKAGAQKFEKTAIFGGDDAVFTEDPDGAVWIVEHHRIYKVADALEGKHHRPEVIPYEDTANDLGFDKTGALWIAGAHTGVSRLEMPGEALKLSSTARKQALEHVTAADGLSSDVALAFLHDREGNLWISTSDGLDRFRPTAVDRAPVPTSFDFFALAAEADGSLLIGSKSSGLHRLSADTLTKVGTVKQMSYTCVYQAPDGKIWLGGTGELGYLEDGHYKPVTIPEPLISSSRDAQAMTTGPNGELWLQMQNSHGIFRLHGDQWISVPNPYLHTMGAAVLLVPDRAGRIWAGSMGEGAFIFDGDKWTRLTKAQGLTVGNVLAFFQAGDRMFIGGEHGLNIAATDHSTELQFAGDVKVEGISGIRRIPDGSLWLNSLIGILRIPSAEVEQALRDPSHKMQYRLFNYLDGLSGKAPQFRPMPSIVQGKGTILWFTTANGVFSIDTAHILTNSVSPPVAIKNVVSDGFVLDASQPMMLSKGSKDLQVAYTALSLSIPERVRFRYKLEGYDKDWQDPGTRRQAFYTHLPPGHYVFHVIACNNDGLWNNAGASAPLYLPPTFVQSWYFKFIVAIFFLTATWFFFVLRIKSETAKMRQRVQERLSERERIARELHDTLFQSVEGSLLHLNAVTSRLPVEQQVKEQLQQAYGEVDRVMGQARSLVFDLRQPVDSQDLAAATMLFAEEVGGLSEVQVEVQVLGNNLLLKPTVHDEVLKIVKECIWNAFRHAHAQHISVVMDYSFRFF